MKNKYLLPILFFSIILLIGCRKEPKAPIPEQELITTLKLTLTDTFTHISHTYTFKDLDGDGGEPATIDTIKLAANKVYTASLLLLDERNFPPDTTTNEIKTLSTEHQFFYQAVPENQLINFTYLDFDTNGKPLGNLFSFKTNNPSQGILRIILRHQPNKSGINVDKNDITHAGGETDIEVDFPLIIY